MCIAFIVLSAANKIANLPQSGKFHFRCDAPDKALCIRRARMLLYGACTHVCQIGNGLGAAKKADNCPHLADARGWNVAIVVPYGVSWRARLLDAGRRSCVSASVYVIAVSYHCYAAFSKRSLLGGCAHAQSKGRQICMSRVHDDR